MRDAEIFWSLWNAGITPVLKDGQLKIRGRESAITPAILETARKHKLQLVAWCKSLGYFQHRGRSAQTLDELHSVLSDFSRGQWSLVERADMSSAYTSVALRLVDDEGASKWRTLEALAGLCWSPALEDGT